MAHKFQIKKNKAGEFVAYFVYNSETIFWTEGYTSKASAKNAIESIKKNGPDAEIDDHIELLSRGDHLLEENKVTLPGPCTGVAGRLTPTSLEIPGTRARGASSGPSGHLPHGGGSMLPSGELSRSD